MKGQPQLPPPAKRRSARALVRPALRGAGLIAVITFGLAACGQATTPAPGGRTPAPSSRPAPGSTRAATAPPSPSASPSPSPPSAAGQLAAFTAAAEHSDGQLRHAAALVNGDIGATSMRFTPATLAAIRDLDNAPAARAIPAGLPAELLREVLVVYGDLASRTGAFGGVRAYGSPGRALPIGSQDAKVLLRGLHNGAPAAARFNADLAAVRTLAQQTPPVTIAPPDSRAAAELALRLDSIDKQNFCSDDFGGWAPATLQPVIWQPATAQHSGHYEGTISGIRFQADYTAAHGWNILIDAC
jgi:hypothetical protein